MPDTPVEVRYEPDHFAEFEEFFRVLDVPKVAVMFQAKLPGSVQLLLILVPALFMFPKLFYTSDAVNLVVPGYSW